MTEARSPCARGPPFGRVALFPLGDSLIFPKILDFQLSICHLIFPNVNFPYRPRRVNLMFYQTEAKAQGWRAVAIFDDERYEALLLLGRSSTQVRGGYVESFMDLLDDEEREHVTSIALQRWQGAPDAG